MKIKFVFVGLFFLFASMGVFAQSSKLIGMWRDGLTNVLITEKYIIVYPHNLNERDSARRLLIYSWVDSNNDGLTIFVNDEFTPYLVSDNNLVIHLPYHSGYGVQDKMLFLTKYASMPASKLVGNWISPAEPVDTEVTISNDQIILKKGRLTKEYNYDLNKFRLADIYSGSGLATIEPLSGLFYLSSVDGSEYDRYVQYFFMDETHILILMDPFSQQTFDYDERTPMLFLTKQ